LVSSPASRPGTKQQFSACRKEHMPALTTPASTLCAKQPLSTCRKSSWRHTSSRTAPQCCTIISCKRVRHCVACLQDKILEAQQLTTAARNSTTVSCKRICCFLQACVLKQVSCKHTLPQTNRTSTAGPPALTAACSQSLTSAVPVPESLVDCRVLRSPAAALPAHMTAMPQV
jgi:hypothetical protein